MTASWPHGSSRIFVSYAREDASDLAMQLRDDLAAAGHDTWLDLAEIAAGASWARDIEEAIENCNVVLALLSAGSYVSDICRGEQLRAIRKGKRIIPVLVQLDADRPLHLENMNYVDFSDPARYQHALDNLLSYIETGYIPHGHADSHRGEGIPPMFPPPKSPVTPATGLKRDTRAFHRYLEDLREEPWLGDRHWWTYSLFYYADVNDIADILETETLQASSKADNKRRTGLWDRYVRLHFRPKTPDLYGAEGILPEGERLYTHCPVPVYLLFDLESVITMPEARFSNGDVMQTGKTYKSAVAFRDLPFDLIYHNQPFSPQERDEILSARRAQVLLPGSLDLSALRHIWCRSTAEYETLRFLLHDETWRKWGDRITARADYDLFNRRRFYVSEATLTEEGVHFMFNPCHRADSDECGPFEFRAEIITADDEHHRIDIGELVPENDLALDLTQLAGTHTYEIRLYADDALAYVGRLGNSH
jgi:hypothetical protein